MYARTATRICLVDLSKSGFIPFRQGSALDLKEEVSSRQNASARGSLGYAWIGIRSLWTVFFVSSRSLYFFTKAILQSALVLKGALRHGKHSTCFRCSSCALRSEWRWPGRL
jgi:hypothetical protein